MSKRNLLDLAALSDPTDSHSLEELRAHLEDGGDMETHTCEHCETTGDASTIGECGCCGHVFCPACFEHHVCDEGRLGEDFWGDGTNSPH